MSADEYDIEVTRGYVHVADIASSPGGAITANRVPILSGDVCVICGWAFAETTGAAAAALRVHDGSATTGGVLARINLTANESVRDWFYPGGLEVTTGRIFIEFISGSYEGVLYWK